MFSLPNITFPAKYDIISYLEKCPDLNGEEACRDLGLNTNKIFDAIAEAFQEQSVADNSGPSD